MLNQEELHFTEFKTEDVIRMAQLAEKYKAETIIIGGVEFIRIPDPDRKRKLVAPTDKPIVRYCNSDYYLINTAKLQSVKDLTLIIGINQSTGIELLKQHQQLKKEKANEKEIG